MKQKQFVKGDKVIYIPENKVYDFGYMSAVKGKAIIYQEGESNMQDSFAVDLYNIKHRFGKAVKIKSAKANLLFHIEMEDQPSSSYERYYVQASGKKDAMKKLSKEKGRGILDRKMTVKRIPKNEIISDIY